MIMLRQDKTIDVGDGRIIQEWTIIDGDTEHKVVSDAEWGDVNILKGGGRKYTVDGIEITSDDIVGLTISAVAAVMDDGESLPIDSRWIYECRVYGVKF